MGTLEAPQDRQIHTQDGASRVEQTDGGQGGAGSSGGQGRWSLVASARPLQPGPLYPPQKKIHGVARGYQQPSGARQTGTRLKKTLVTVWSITATAGWLVNMAAAGWRDHNRQA